MVVQYKFVFDHEYEARRDYVVEMLSVLGFQVQSKPMGSTFVFAELPDFCWISYASVFCLFC
jgi:aspartate/methionine/tyrosine aminotransferase